MARSALRTSNPALNPDLFHRERATANSSEAMTVSGTVNKTGILLLLVLLTGSWSWMQAFQQLPYSAEGGVTTTPYMWIGALGGLGVAFVIFFKKTWAPFLAPVYALLEGLFLGAISAAFEAMYPGIVTQAVGGTLGTLLVLLFIYRAGIIEVTDNFRTGVAAATGGIFFLYMINFVIGFFGVSIPFVHEGGIFGILFSLFVVGVAALNLVLDFDFIESGEKSGAPKYMEWFAAFGLMVTLIWLYIEILRLLSKLRSR